MQTTPPVYIIGDIHGHLRHLQKILQSAHLIDRHHAWSGGEATLWFLGDLVDRGPDGIGVIDLIMRLQTEAAAAGGSVECLLGNHEVLLLSAYRFGRRSTGLSSNFLSRWRQNGGKKEDLAKLTKQHLEWLAARPPMAHIGKVVLIHADSTFYSRYGHSENEVNETFKKLLTKSDALAWEELLEAFAMRGVFNHKLAGDEFIQRFLMIFGGEQIIHGHTPINLLLDCPAKKVVEALVYAEGRCVDVDGGMYLGGPGFLHQLPANILASANLQEIPIDKSQDIE